MLDHFVHRRRYLTEDELIEINALCSALPGPSSTQTLAAVGYKLGGPLLSVLALLVWVLPASILMTMVAFIYVYAQKLSFNLQFLRFLQPIATGFILVAAIRLGKNVLKTPLSWFIMIGVAILTTLFRSPYLIPAMLFSGGILAFAFSRELEGTKAMVIKPNWKPFFVWLGILILLAIVGSVTQWRWVLLFENTYRNGSLVFGGGQVLIPMMFEQFVHFKHYLSEQDFLTGYGIAQAIPGPVFSFTSFLCGVSLFNLYHSNTLLIAGAAVGMVGIFMPGIFFIFFVYPIWNQIKHSRGVSKSLLGINSAATGLIVSAFLVFFNQTPYKMGSGDWITDSIVIISVVIMQLMLKIASHFIVALGIGAGIIVALMQIA